MEDLLQVGVITTTHGVRRGGQGISDDGRSSALQKLKNVILDTGKEKLEL